jgi:hypothetical protein
MVLSDEDRLFLDFDPVWCGETLRFDHEHGCNCFTADDDDPLIDGPASEEREEEECPF